MRVRGTCASGARGLGLRVERGGDMLLRVRSEVRQVEDASLHQPVFPRQGSQGQHRRQRQVGPAELVACLSICLSANLQPICSCWSVKLLVNVRPCVQVSIRAR